ncbi:hypothetical protein OESDEN_04302 [Oesophagostomum dentatum]|uniref:Uncharacterized protein n=1 Tax=Oesophagostomum dentatum TaxID=61180 RepID=A0A0B1TK17_OESDE|nr:hypothetical protein OESDEN_04302 [Oesophagostomum dentatum]
MTILLSIRTWKAQLLESFANSEFRLPPNIYGSDNGALHTYLAEILMPPNRTELRKCNWIYENCRGYGDLFLFENCIRKLLGNSQQFGKVKILRKVSTAFLYCVQGTGWVRDHGLTNSKWSVEDDFMIHNWKAGHQLTYKVTPIP